MIEQYLGSIANFVKSNYADAQVYTGITIPEEIPPGLCVYLPLPNASPARLTSASSSQMLFMPGRVFHNNTRLAYTVASTLSTMLQRKRNTLPIINIDGSVSERSFFVDNVSFQSIEDGVASFDLTWYYRFIDDIAPFEKIGGVHITRRD